MSLSSLFTRRRSTLVFPSKWQRSGFWKQKAVRLPRISNLFVLTVAVSVLFVWTGVRVFDRNGDRLAGRTLGNEGELFTKDSSKRTIISKTKQRLRLNWENLPLYSELAKRLQAHQRDCSLPLANFPYRNLFGLGSDLHVWGQALCNAMEQRVRIRTLMPWAFLDETICDLKEANRSAMLCYFPQSELLCKGDDAIVENEGYINVTLRKRVGFNCESIMKGITTPEFRAAGVEFLFSGVSRKVVQDAERQLNLVFPHGIPPNLVTVHVRWGDKKSEMKLLPVDDYIRAVMKLLDQKGLPSDEAHVYLATEDPEAVKEFQQKCPRGWKLYVDQFFHDMKSHRIAEYNGMQKASKAMQGHVGLISLGSLLVAMEANLFVLTTASNWSRLMNELRKNVLNPRCNNCTLMVDLKQGEW